VDRRSLLLASAGAMLPRGLGAQPRAWPGARPIEVVVPFPPGGGMDVMARSFLPFLQPHLPGATFVVVNRAGAGGQIGTEAVANAAPDGHTIGAAAFPALVSTPIERRVRWRPTELTYLASVVDDPCGLFVPPASPLRGLADLLTKKAPPRPCRRACARGAGRRRRASRGTPRGWRSASSATAPSAPRSRASRTPSACG
jgi:tripartite-type tricarboxylate transporter receptor subunit TctC